MNEAVKSISLDEIGDMPRPIGMSGPGERTQNKALQYTPQYASQFQTTTSTMPVSGNNQETQKRSEKFSIASSMSLLSAALPIKFSQSKHTALIALGVGLLAAGAAVYIFYGEALFESLSGRGDNQVESEPVNEPQRAEIVKTKSKSVKVETLPAPLQVTAEVKEIPGNPYWKLPNPVASAAEAAGAISPQQTESWRGGLAHPFNFQRYKAAESMRQAKIYGSVSILYEAIAQPKLWTRMEALLGIAEQGLAIDTDSMRAAIGDARSDLVRNYFRRFRQNYGDGAAHVMRQALRVTDPSIRTLILSILADHRDKTNDMYLIAGTKDVDPKTGAFAKRILNKRAPMAAAEEAYRAAVSMTAVVEKKPNVPKASAVDIQVEKIPANLNVEEVYFVKDDEASPVEDSKPEEAPAEVKEDDGFNDLNPSNQSATPTKTPMSN